jgi:hypothetical protein
MSKQLRPQKKIAHLRDLACARQHGLCHYCTFPMLGSGERGPTALRCEAEHLFARCDGGADDAFNIVAACTRCNRTRHKRTRAQTAEGYLLEVRLRILAGRWHSAAEWAWAADRGWTPELAAHKNSENVLVSWGNPKLANVYLKHFERNYAKATPYRQAY